MEGQGRWLDNVAGERFGCSIKYEDIYLKSKETARGLARGIESYILHYNQYRPHQSLNEATPGEIKRKNGNCPMKHARRPLQGSLISKT